MNDYWQEWQEQELSKLKKLKKVALHIIPVPLYIFALSWVLGQVAIIIDPSAGDWGIATGIFIIGAFGTIAAAFSCWPASLVLWIMYNYRLAKYERKL